MPFEDDGIARCLTGDARDEAVYRALLGDRRADALITDPPYCLLTRRRKRGDLRDPKGRKIDSSSVLRFESVRDYRRFTLDWMAVAQPYVSPGAPWVIWTNLLGKAPIVESAKAHGYPHLEGEFVWAKRTTERGSGEYWLRVYEVALVFFPRPPPPRSISDPPTVWCAIGGYDDDGEAQKWGGHPNHKPFSILEPLLRTYSRKGDLVLDPFAGSGSIPAAAVRLSRQAAAIEQNPQWVEQSRRRLEQALSG